MAKAANTKKVQEAFGKRVKGVHKKKRNKHESIKKKNR